MKSQCEVGENKSCSLLNNDIQSLFICLSPLCLQRLKIMCHQCSNSQIHQSHLVVRVQSIFEKRNLTINNEIKYYALNIFKLKELKQQQNDQLQNFINKIQDYKNQIIQSIDKQIDIQTQLIQEMFRLESIAQNYYDQQLQYSERSLSVEIQNLLSDRQLIPKFQITNLIQQSQDIFQIFSSNINKKEELDEINACITKNFMQRNFETKESKDLLEHLKQINSFGQYESLQKTIEDKQAIGLRYSRQLRKLESELSSFSDQIVPFIKQADILPQFDELQPSKLFYDTNFRVIMNKYFSQGETLISLNFRLTDDRFFKTPPFLHDFQFKNLIDLSVNINSLDFKNLINFIQNHPQIENLDIFLNADQQLLVMSNLRSLFSIQVLPNVQKFKINITRLNFSSSIQILDLHDFAQPIIKFLNEKRNSIQTFEIDGLIEFSYSIEHFQSIFFNQQNQRMTHLKKLTFLVTDIDFLYDPQKILLNDLHHNIFTQMPLLQEIKLYKTTQYQDIEKFFKMLNSQLKTKADLIKLFLLIKSRLKFYRKEIIYEIIQEYVKTIFNMINTNIF